MLPSTRKACVYLGIIVFIISARSRIVPAILLSYACWTRLSASARRTRSYTMFMDYLSPWLRKARGFLSRCLHQSQVEQSPRPCTVAVCSSAQEFNIRALIDRLQEMRPDGNVAFRFVELPYNDLDNFRLDAGLYDGVILCHSIHNRRFSITDVLDALYDRFLPNAARVFGKENVCVIVHDFPWPLKQNRESSRSDDHAKVKEGHMESFRVRQPTTFQCCDLAMICGNIDTDVEMDKDDQHLIEKFIDGVLHAYMTSQKRTYKHGKPKLDQVQTVGIFLPFVLGLVYSVRLLRQMRARNLQKADSTDRSAVQYLVVEQEERELEAMTTNTSKEQEHIEEMFLHHHMVRALDMPPTLHDQESGTGHQNSRSSSFPVRERLTKNHKCIGRSTMYEHPDDLDGSEVTFTQHHMDRALDTHPIPQGQYLESSARSRLSHQKTKCLLKSKL